MQSIDWMARAVESEVAYSEARGGTATAYDDFIHIHNSHVPWGGDYNRAVGVRVSSLEEFADVIRQVERIHEERNLERPDSYDTYPSLEGDGEWIDGLGDIEHRSWTDVFFKLEVGTVRLPDGFEWRPVGEDEYLQWRRAMQQKEGWYDAEAWELGLPLERQFIQTYRPYWLFENGHRVAWVHCANLGSHFRLFDVEVDKPLHGRGYGKILLQAVAAEAGAQRVAHILIRCVERLRGFYESCGFDECGKGTVVRLRSGA